MNHCLRSFARALRVLICLVPALAWADSAPNGASLYATHCASCHGSSPLTSNSNKIYNGRNARAVTDAAINNVGDMTSLRSAFPAGGSALADVAAYLGNTPTSITFASTAVNATSAASMVTVYASLKAGASISGLSVSTTGDFARSGGTCGSAVATGTSCTIGVVFKPTATGTRSGTLSLTHNNTLSAITIALTGTATGGATSAPVATISPTSLTFGSTAIGTTSATQNLNIANSGNAALNLTSIAYSSAEFITAGGTCVVPGSVAAGASCTVAVAFRPTSGSTGARSATLSIAHNAAGSPGSVGLAGTAAAALAPVASFTPSLAFGSVNVGSSGSAQTATLSNTGTAGLVIGSIATASSEFTPSGGTCAAGATVAAGSSCTIGVGFTPAAAGPRTATLTVTHNAAGGSSTSALSGSGVALSPQASVSPAALSFTQTVNTTSAAQTVTLSNPGTAPLTIGTLAVSGAQAAEFQIASGGTCTAGASVAASGSCTVRITFAPTATGARSASLAITHDASGSPTSVSLAGTGTAAPQPSISVDATALTFGSQTVGSTSAAQAVTLTNSGAATLTFASFTLTGAAAGDFTRGGTCAGTLAAGASCSVSFTFTPAAVGARSATLTIASDASNGSAVLSLAGSGAAAATPAVTLTPAALDFGNQAVGSSSAARNVTLTNSGSGALAIAGITATSGFALTHNCGAGLAPAQSCTLAVTFSPASTGAAVGSVSVASNAAGSPHAVALAGNAVTASPVLAWTPAASALDFGSVSVGSSSTRTLTLTNQGPGVVTLTQFTLAGAQGGDFAFVPGSTCAANAQLAVGAGCTFIVGFQPAAAGARSATLQVTSTGTNPPDVTLSGTGSAPAQAQIAIAPTALAFAAAASAAAPAQELVVQSSGGAVLHVGAIRVAAGSFAIGTAATQGCPTAPFDLLPGQSCRVAVSWSSTAAGSETGAIEFDSNASATALSVPLAATREAPAAVMTNVGAGGCSIAGRHGIVDPTLWLLVALALAVLWRRRT